MTNPVSCIQEPNITNVPLNESKNHTIPPLPIPQLANPGLTLSPKTLAVLSASTLPYALIMEKTKELIERGNENISAEQRLLNAFIAGHISGVAVSSVVRGMQSLDGKKMISLSPQVIASMLKKDGLQLIKTSFSSLTHEGVQKMGIRGGLLGLAVHIYKYLTEKEQSNST